MFNLSLSIFGRYLSINAGRITDVWEDEDEDTTDEPGDEPVVEKGTACEYIDDLRWYG